MPTYTQAVDLQRVHSEVQQQAAVLQNVTGLAEEVRHAIVAICQSVQATWHRLSHSMT